MLKKVLTPIFEYDIVNLRFEKKPLFYKGISAKMIFEN